MLSPIPLRTFDVASLRALVASTEEHHDRFTRAAKVHAHSRSDRDAKLLNASSDGPGVSEIPEPQAHDPLSDPEPSAVVSNRAEPSRVRLAPIGADIDLDVQLSRQGRTVA